MMIKMQGGSWRECRDERWRPGVGAWRKPAQREEVQRKKFLVRMTLDSNR